MLSVTECIGCIVFKYGLKIPSQIVLEVDALPKYWRVNKFWRFGKLSYKIMADNSFVSLSPLLGMIFVNWFLFSSSGRCWVSQDASDVSYSNGLKIPSQIVLEVDALPKYWRVNKFWRFGKLSYKIMADNSFVSLSPLLGMIFVNWFLFSSSGRCWVSQNASDVSYSNMAWKYHLK